MGTPKLYEMKGLQVKPQFPEALGHLNVGCFSGKSKIFGLLVYCFPEKLNLFWDGGLDKIWEEKPLINGKDIMGIYILQLKTGGPVVREWQQKLLQWQIAYPCGTAKECIDWMQQTQSKRARAE